MSSEGSDAEVDVPEPTERGVAEGRLEKEDRSRGRDWLQDDSNI